MQFTGVATASNTGGVTAQIAGFVGTFPVYKDTSGGPVALVGGELILNCAFTLIYDQALNSNAGGFHLETGTASSITGLSPVFNSVQTGTLVVTGYASIALATIATASIVQAQAASLQIGTGQYVTRLTSTLVASVVFAGAGANAVSAASISFAAAQANDNIVLGLPSNSPTAVNFVPWVSASGTVVINAFSGVTVAPVTLAIRVTDLGWT
jgi:hypothetical protein